MPFLSADGCARIWALWQVVNSTEADKYGGFVEFIDVDLRVGGLDGLWSTRGLWNLPRGLRADAAAETARGEAYT